MRRSLYSALIALGLAAGSPALAGSPLLPPAKHAVASQSYRYNGTHAHKQGMHIRITDAHPESTIVIERQKRSGHAEIANVTSEEQLIQAAAAATKWHEHLVLKTENASQREPFDQIIRDPQKVMRPNSRFRVKATTRDGQTIHNHGGVVTGHYQVNESRHNVITGSAENITLAGRNMKSARAWDEPHNLFVSIPSTDEQMIADGKAKLALAEQHGRVIEKETFDLNASNGTMDYQTQQTKQAEINKLTQEKAQLEQEGNQLVTEGSRNIAHVISVGAFPVAATVKATNTRTHNESGQRSMFSKASSPESGYLHEQIEALPQDKLQLAVHFDAAESNVDSHLISFRVPHEGKPAFELAGRKYYRVQVDSAEQHSADPSF